MTPPKTNMTQWRDLQSDLGSHGYVAADDLAMALHIALALGRPLLLEGAAGVGKTEVARTLAAVRATQLIRLQCYEGLDAAQAIYEWNYQRQLLAIRASAEAGETGPAVEARLFSDEFLLERPLLKAILQPVAPVLLIDEIDRADEEFEAYLLEILSDYQITIPEIGTIPAVTRPMVILTANGGGTAFADLLPEDKVALVATLAGIREEDFRALNPSLNKPVIMSAGTPHVLLPWDNAVIFQRKLQAYSGPLASWTAWVVPSTMTVAQAAERVGMSEAELRKANAIPPRMRLRAGSAPAAAAQWQTQT